MTRQERVVDLSAEDLKVRVISREEEATPGLTLPFRISSLQNPYYPISHLDDTSSHPEQNGIKTIN